MLEKFKHHIENQLTFLSESKILIAISGGQDSVVLTHLCKSLNLNITLAHCNFKLRGDESDADENFVVNLAQELDIEVFLESFDTKTYAENEKLSIQMAARELRYHWFESLLKDLKYDYVLTAHHADDQIETILINLTRGSGLKGLTGIPEINDYIIRPLLPFSKEELESYAKNNKLNWREDSSNASEVYLRNKLRHRIVPILKEMSPDLVSSFNKTISNLKDSASIIDDKIVDFKSKAIADIEENQIKFKISKFKKTNHPKAYLFELLSPYGFTEWNDILNLLEAQSGKYLLSGTHRIVKDRKHLILTRLTHSEESEHSFYIGETEKQIEFDNGILVFDDANVLNESSKATVFVDKEKLKFPMLLRKWQKGDVFYPLGMQGKKKLSKYFKDEKYSLVDKENAWVLTSDDNLVWIVNKRGDNRYKVTEDTKHILKISFQKKT